MEQGIYRGTTPSITLKAKKYISYVSIWDENESRILTLSAIMDKGTFTINKEKTIRIWGPVLNPDSLKDGVDFKVRLMLNAGADAEPWSPSKEDVDVNPMEPIAIKMSIYDDGI